MRTLAEMVDGGRCWTPLGDVAHRLRLASSPLVGCVSPALDVLRSSRDASCALAYARAHALGPGGAVVHGNSAKPDRLGAVVAAQAEAVERYSAGIPPDPEHTVCGPAQEMEPPVVDLELIAPYGRWQYGGQFPFQRLTPDLSLRWVAMAQPDGTAALVPADFAYLLPPRVLVDPPVVAATSNGLAASATWLEAAARGLAEVIERDAVMFAWRRRPPVPVLTADADRVASASTGWPPAPTSIRVLDLSPVSLGAIPVMFARVSQVDVTGFGAGVGPTPRAAFVAAVNEAFQTLPWARTLLRASRHDRGHVDEIHSFDDHARFHADPSRRGLSDGLFGEPCADGAELPNDHAAVPDPAQWLRTLRAAVERDGLTSWFADVTSADIAEVGLRVVRAIVPGAIGIEGDGRYPMLGAMRLLRPVPSLGMPRVGIDGLSSLPHPLP